MENAAWISAAREMKISHVVIDRAHCISMWGQSFRPNYPKNRKSCKTVTKELSGLGYYGKLQPPRVQADIIEQVGSDLIPIRGQLLRHNIGLYVVDVQVRRKNSFGWLNIYPGFAKTGIVLYRHTG